MKALVLTGLAFGDETKGATTHWASHAYSAHTVVRTGGAQALHSVVTADGREHTFSHYGSGTLAGARTHMSRYMIVEPYAFLNEGRALQEFGIDIFNRTTISEEALVITPFQIIANRLREFARGANRRGTVGKGVGETVFDSELHGDIAIRVKDFGKPWLVTKLEAIRQLKLRQLAPLIEKNIYTGDLGEKVALLQNPSIVNEATSEFNYLAELVDIVDDSFLGEILRQPGTVVFEPSQGVLLDRWYGFHPYTTKAKPTPDAALELLAQYGYDGEVVRLGLTRCYFTRHGAGPFVTEDTQYTEQIPDLRNPYNKWQGHFRVGPLDTVALRYAIEVCGGYEKFDGLVVSCLDELSALSVWQICDRYKYRGSEEVETLKQFFNFDGDLISGIIVRHNSRDKPQLDHQKKLGELLRDCEPVYIKMDPGNHEAYLQLIEELVKIPVVLTSYGPTENDRRVMRSL